MGSVTHRRLSGDNDYPIYPVEYNMHFMYCDRCGSFELQDWKEPDNYTELEGRHTQLQKVVRWSALASVISIIPTFMGMPLFLGGSLITLAGSSVGSWYFKSRVHSKGVRCANCQATYEYGGPFFSTNLHDNPLNLSYEDVLRPEYLNLRIPGETFWDTQQLPE